MLTHLRLISTKYLDMSHKGESSKEVMNVVFFQRNKLDSSYPESPSSKIFPPSYVIHPSSQPEQLSKLLFISSIASHSNNSLSVYIFLDSES